MADYRTAPRQTNDSPIARLRIARGLTQAQLAERIGCPQASVSRWERGVSQPGMRYILRLSQALNCSPNDLVPLSGLPEDQV